MARPVTLRARVARKAPDLPRFVVVPSESVAPWRIEITTPVEVALDGVALGRRNLKRWGKGRDCWFFDLPQAWCDRAGIGTGDRIDVLLARAGDDLPTELAALLDAEPSARERWSGLTAARQRALADHVRGAKQPQTRARRARSLLG